MTVVERQAPGPFDVSSLATPDAGALSGWLDANGYKFPDRLADALKPCVDQEWKYVAVRLVPETAGKALRGALDPLHVTFASDRINYPMRLSALARNQLPVFLYVLADHRVDAPPVRLNGDGPSVKFAGWVDPKELPQDSPIAPLVPRRMFLTKLVAQIYQPESIKDDWVFGFADNDTSFRDVEVRYVVDSNPIPGIGGIWLSCLLVLGAVAFAALLWMLLQEPGVRRV